MGFNGLDTLWNYFETKVGDTLGCRELFMCDLLMTRICWIVQRCRVIVYRARMCWVVGV